MKHIGFISVISWSKPAICMDNIKRERTLKTPEVDFNAETGDLLLEGISIPENTVEFYHTLLYWINEYAVSPKETTTLTLKLEYFNTSTSVVMLNMFKLLSEIEGTHVVINWYYEIDDIEMEEVGKDYRNMVEVDFNLIPVDQFD